MFIIAIIIIIIIDSNRTTNILGDGLVSEVVTNHVARKREYNIQYDMTTFQLN